MTKNIHDKIGATIAMLFILGGFYGLHNDYTLYILVIPFGWLICGVLFDFLVNGNDTTKASGIISILCFFILTNIALILIHNDNSFVLGRLLCSIGACILIVNIAKEESKKNK